MADSEISICLSGLPHYECGALLFSYLAFPEPGAEDTRADVHASLCHLALKAITQDDPDGQWTPAVIKPGYALLSESKVRTSLRTMDRRLRDRLDAATVAKPFLEQATTGKTPRLPAGVDSLTLTSMAEYLMFRTKPNADGGDLKNFHARVWKPSLPVIHLAVALNVLFERTNEASLGTLAIHDLIRSPEVIRFLLETAEPLEPLFQEIAALGVPENTLVRFRFT